MWAIAKVALCSSLLIASACRAGSTHAAASLPNAYPLSITTAADGSVWFIQNAGIERIAPNGQMTLVRVPGMRQLTANSPGEFSATEACLFACGQTIVGGRDGSLYFITSAGVDRMDPGGRLSGLPIAWPAGWFGRLENLMVAPDGSVWVAAHCRTLGQALDTSEECIASFRPNSQQVRWLSPVIGNDSMLAPSLEDTIWLALGNSVSRIDPHGRTLFRRTFPTVQRRGPGASGAATISSLFGVGAGKDGSLWFGANLNGGSSVGSLGHVAADGSMALYPVPFDTYSGIPAAIAVGNDGSAWFTEVMSNRIGVLTPKGKVRTFAVPAERYDLVAEVALNQRTGITLGGDGNMWFTETCTNTIGRVMPSGKITRFHIPGTASRAADWCFG